MVPVIDGSVRQRWNRLWMLDHCLGPTRVDRWLPGRREEVRASMDAEMRKLPDGGPWVNVDERQGLDPRTFLAEYVDQDRPVILRGAAKDWEAIKRWDFDFFIEHYGDEPIDLIHATLGDGGADRNAGRQLLGPILQAARDGGGAYPRFAPLLHRHPELIPQLDGTFFKDMRGPKSVGTVYQIFLGGPGSNTAMHCAVGSNLFVQVHGKKRWLILSPEFTPALDVVLDRAPYFFSHVDVRTPDLARFPWLGKVKVMVADLEAGDVLYNPPFFWHQVMNATASIGVGYRYYDFKVMTRVSKTQTALTYMATNPPLVTAMRLNGDFSAMFTGRWRELQWIPRLRKDSRLTWKW